MGVRHETSLLSEWWEGLMYVVEEVTNPIRLLAMQVEKSGNMEPSSPSINEIDQAIASGMCSGMPRHWYLSARLKWCLDTSVRNELEQRLMKEAIWLSKNEKWRVPKGRNYIEKMVILSMDETLDPRSYKPAWVKSQVLGMDDSRFSRVWSERYEGVFSYIRDWSDCAIDYLKKKQRR